MLLQRKKGEEGQYEFTNSKSAAIKGQTTTNKINNIDKIVQGIQTIFREEKALYL